MWAFDVQPICLWYYGLPSCNYVLLRARYLTMAIMSYNGWCKEYKFMVLLCNDPKICLACMYLKSYNHLRLILTFTLFIDYALTLSLLGTLGTTVYPKNLYYTSRQPNKHMTHFFNFHYSLDIRHERPLSDVQACVPSCITLHDLKWNCPKHVMVVSVLGTIMHDIWNTNSRLKLIYFHVLIDF